MGKRRHNITVDNGKAAYTLQRIENPTKRQAQNLPSPDLTKCSSDGSTSDTPRTRTYTELEKEKDTDAAAAEDQRREKVREAKALRRRAKDKEESRKHDKKKNRLKQMRNPLRRQSRRPTRDPGALVFEPDNRKQSNIFQSLSIEQLNRLTLQDSEAASSANSSTGAA